MSHHIPIRLTSEERARVKRFMEANSMRYMSEFFLRQGMRTVTLWEQEQAEHQARLNAAGAAS